MKEFLGKCEHCKDYGQSSAPANYTVSQTFGFDYPRASDGKYNIQLTTPKSETQKYQEIVDEERKANRDYYEQKPMLEVTESNIYTDDSAWAHTLISEGKINIRPPESIDDSLGVFPHEITHNFFPNLRNESYVSMIGNGPMRGYIIKSFRYSVHR